MIILDVNLDFAFQTFHVIVVMLLVFLCFGNFWRVESKPLKLFGFLQDQTYSVDCAGYLKEGEEEGGVTLKERVPGEGRRDVGGGEKEA